MPVLAVDPGGTTGWAAIGPAGDFRSGEIRDWLDWLIQVQWLIESEGYDIVVERYTITTETAKKSRQYDALEIIGALRWMCYAYSSKAHPIKFTLQTPAEAKAFSTDRKLHRMGWFTRGRGHANDAARHLMLYSVRQGLIDPTVLLEEAT